MTKLLTAPILCHCDERSDMAISFFNVFSAHVKSTYYYFLCYLIGSYSVD